MTVTSHAVIASGLTYLVTGNTEISIARGILALLPDFVGWIGLAIKKNWLIYNKMHETKWGWIFYPEHKLVDKLTHKPPGGWQDWTLPSEIVLFVLMLITIFSITTPDWFIYLFCIWTVVLMGVVIYRLERK